MKICLDNLPSDITLYIVQGGAKMFFYTNMFLKMLNSGHRMLIISFPAIVCMIAGQIIIKSKFNLKKIVPNIFLFFYSFKQYS